MLDGIIARPFNSQEEAAEQASDGGFIPLIIRLRGKRLDECRKKNHRENER
jgi:hypothetical protein